MIKISEIVEEIVRQKPFLEQSISEGLINATALARQIQPQIEHRLGKPVQTGAIVMAIKRMPLHPSIHLQKNITALRANLHDFTIRSRLAIFSYRNAPTLMAKQARLAQQARADEDIFYTFSRGLQESTLVISQHMQPTVEHIFEGEKLKWHGTQMSAITIKLKAENTTTPGLYYHILKLIAWHNINLSEVISTTNEFTLIMKQNYINDAFQAFSGFMDT